jgi:hypothetical protein
MNLIEIDQKIKEQNKNRTPQYKRQKAAKTHRFCGFLTFILRGPKIASC